MREIKFRTWDKITEQMWDWYTMPDVHEVVANEARWILMQYTGLKDKDKKEIYEGDILQGSNTSPKYKVIWDSCRWSAGFEHKGNSGNISLFERNTLFEIIGNIYENKELLT